MPLLVGGSELASVIYDSIELSNCAHAGAMYGMISSTFAADTAGIQKAAQAEAADFGTSVTVTPTSYYACSNTVDGTQYTTQSAAAAACPANASNHYLQFIKVVSNVSVTPPMQFPGLPEDLDDERVVGDGSSGVTMRIPDRLRNISLYLQGRRYPSRLAARKKNESGQAVVEIALALPIIAAFIFTMIEICLAYLHVLHDLGVGARGYAVCNRPWIDMPNGYERILYGIRIYHEQRGHAAWVGRILAAAQ